MYTSTRVNPGEIIPESSVNEFWVARGAICDGEGLRLATPPTTGQPRGASVID